MSCCDTQGLMPFDQALERLLTSVKASRKTEHIKLENCLDRILSQNVVAPINVPGYDNSAMDGYALRAQDLTAPNTLQLAGKSFAGQPFEGELLAGQCVRIMTGAQIPSGADCVIMQEDSRVEGKQVIFSRPATPNSHIRRAGEDISQGSSVLNAGRRLGPADIGLLASLGLAQVEVVQPLRVGLLSTGDELRLPGETLDNGCIYDSNRFVVAAMLERLGVELLDLGIVADNKNALRQALQKAADSCDIVISSGGVSVGDADYIKDILLELGQVDFWKLAIKPGKPFAFGRLGKAIFFGLPGNPVSAAVTFHQLALPTLRKMAGEYVAPELTISAETRHNLNKRPGRTDFQRGLLTQGEQGEQLVCDTGSQGSGMLSSMSQSNCYIKLAADCDGISAGESVSVIPYDRWLA